MLNFAMVLNWGWYELFGPEVTVTTDLMGLWFLHHSWCFSGLTQILLFPEDMHPNYRMSVGLTLTFRFQNHMSPLNGTSKLMKEQTPNRCPLSSRKRGNSYYHCKFQFYALYLYSDIACEFYICTLKVFTFIFPVKYISTHVPLLRDCKAESIVGHKGTGGLRKFPSTSS